MGERERLAFVEKVDGKEAMLKFAKQTLGIYIEDSIRKGPYADSIKVLRAVLAKEKT